MDKPQQPQPDDPDTVPEIVGVGPTNLSVTGPIVTFTFTHVRKNVASTFTELTPENAESVVRARIVMPVEMALEVRNLIDNVIKPMAPGSTARN